MNQSKLSQQQKAILGWICAFGYGPECKKERNQWGEMEKGLARSERYCNKNGEKGSTYDLIRYCYILSRTNGQRSKSTRSESASFSRSVKELWQRGLVGMYNTTWAKGYEVCNRCTHITISPVAIDLAKSCVTAKMSEFVRARWLK